MPKFQNVIMPNLSSDPATPDGGWHHFYFKNGYPFYKDDGGIVRQILHDAPSDGQPYARKDGSWFGIGNYENVQSDWNVTSTGSDAYIKNKPDLSQYLTQNETINLTDEVTGSGRTSISTTLQTTAINNRSLVSAYGDLSGQDQFLLRDYSTDTLMKLSLDVLQNYMQNNLSFSSGGYTFQYDGNTINDGKEIQVNGSSGLTHNTYEYPQVGDGNWATSINLGTPSSITGSSSNNVTTTSHTHKLDIGLSDLSDVSIGQGYTLSTDDLLTYDGQYWVNRPRGQFSVSDFNVDIGIPDLINNDLSDLGNTSISGLSSGHLLEYDGSNWVNNSVSDVLSTVPVKGLLESSKDQVGAGLLIYSADISDHVNQGKSFEQLLYGVYTLDHSNTFTLIIRAYDTYYNKGTILIQRTIGHSTSINDDIFHVRAAATIRSIDSNDNPVFSAWIEWSDSDQNIDGYYVETKTATNIDTTTNYAALQITIEVNEENTPGDECHIYQGHTKILN